MALSRKKGLRADPEKVRAFINRGRQSSLGREGMRSSAERRDLSEAVADTLATRPRKALRRTGGRKRRSLPPAVRRPAQERQRGLCITLGCRRKPWQRHHILPVTRFPELELEPDNLVAICPECHADHESANKPLLRSWLPACALALAARVGGRAEAEIDRHYPLERAEPGGSR